MGNGFRLSRCFVNEAGVHKSAAFLLVSGSPVGVVLHRQCYGIACFGLLVSQPGSCAQFATYLRKTA